MRDLRIAHIADSHLGYRSSTIPGRDEDFAKSWILACRAIVDSAPDLILHAGDIFHHPNPPWSAFGSFLEGAAILKEANVPILMISGNHDSSRIAMRSTVFSVLAEALPYITISHSPNPEIHHLREADVVLLSHRALLNPRLHKNLQEILDGIDTTSYTVLVAHGDIGPLNSSDELGSIVIPHEVFDFPWSYVALGHLHVAQSFGRNGWYSGSIERCGWSDYPATPGWTLTTISRDKPIYHVQRQLPHLKMIQLPNLRCEGMIDFDIEEDILRLMDNTAIPETRSVIRILIQGIPPGRQRVLRSSTQRLVKTQYPNVLFQLVVESKTSIIQKVTAEFRPEPMVSIEESFSEFVATRTYTEVGFKEIFLRKGLAALEKVRIEEAEGDTGDERSVPAG